MSRVPFTIALAFVCLVPGAAEACSVCFSTTEENRWAFITTTVFLSILPLGILFGIGTWLRRQILEMERQHEKARIASPPRL